MANLSNNQWQEVGKNLTGAAFSFAIFFSLWSLGFLWADVSYCRYPTAVNHADSELSYCTVFGTGLPDKGLPSKSFMTDCDAQQSLMVGKQQTCDSGFASCTAAAQTNVSFYQLFSPATTTPTSQMDFAADNLAAADLLPSQEIEIRRWAQEVAGEHAKNKHMQPPIFEPLDIPEVDATMVDRPCAYNAGSVIEAIQTYADDCESNTRMRDSTLLVSTLFVLNVLEMLMLLKIGLTTDRLTVPVITDHLLRARQTAGARHSSRKACSMTSWLLTHAELVANPTFMFPIRLVTGVVVSVLLMSGALASIDYSALQATRSIESIEQSYNAEFVPMMRDGLGDYLSGLSEQGGGEPLTYHNEFFDAGAELSARSAYPAFNKLDDDCPCSLSGTLRTIGKNLAGHAFKAACELASSGRRRRLLENVGNVVSHHRVLAENEGCPPNSKPNQDGRCSCIDGFSVNNEETACVEAARGVCPGVANAYVDADGSCYCERDFRPSDTGDGCIEAGLNFEITQIRDILQKWETGLASKCTVQYMRELWEPIPFCIRYASYIAMLIGLVSTFLFLSQFRVKALRLRVLVEEHFDPVTGWPKDPGVLNEEDVRLLTGGKRSWTLDYAYLNKLPSFIGLYCGNMMVAFLMHWLAWMVALYFTFCQAFPSDLFGLLILVSPVMIEGILKKMLWKKVVSPKQGLLHPRIYLMVDVALSLASTITGPIKTVFRVVGATLCLFMHLFRSDVTMMLDQSFFALDPHYTSATALLTALRIQYEFSKIGRTRPVDARLSHLKIQEGYSESEDNPSPMQQMATVAAALDTLEAVDIFGGELVS